MMLLKMIDITELGKEPANEEIRMFLKSLKPGMKLPLFNKYGYPDKYVEQLIAENYLNGLLEGYTLKFIVPRLLEYLDDKLCLVLKRRKRFSATLSVIQRRELTNMILRMMCDLCFMTPQMQIVVIVVMMKKLSLDFGLKKIVLNA